MITICWKINHDSATRVIILGSFMIYVILLSIISIIYMYKNISCLSEIKDQNNRLLIKCKDMSDFNDRITSLKEQIRSTEKTLYMIKDELSRFRAYNDSIRATRDEFNALAIEIRALEEKIKQENSKKGT